MKRSVLSACALAIAAAVSASAAFAHHTPLHSALQNDALIKFKKQLRQIELQKLRVPCPRCPPPPCLSCPPLERIGPAVRTR